jgi:hypothetical protein
MLKTLVGELQPDNGTVKWSENAQLATTRRIMNTSSKTT